MNAKEVMSFLKTCDYAHVVTPCRTKTVINCKYMLLYVKRFAKKVKENEGRIVYKTATPATLNEWINAKGKDFYWHADELFLSADFSPDLSPTLQD